MKENLDRIPDGFSSVKGKSNYFLDVIDNFYTETNLTLAPDVLRQIINYFDDFRKKHKCDKDGLLLIKQRYFREVIAYPNGSIVHHGDCNIYSSPDPFCDCGLLYDLGWLSFSLAIKVYPKYAIDQAKQDGVKIKISIIDNLDPESLIDTTDWQRIEETFGNEFKCQRRLELGL